MQLKIFEMFIQEAMLQALPQAKLSRVEAPSDGELVNWPEPIQVSIMSFQSEKIQGTALMGCDISFLELTCPCLDPKLPGKDALLQDWLGELSNLVIGRIKNKLLPYGEVLKLNPPSVFETGEEVFGSYAKRKDNLKLWFKSEQQHFCIALSMDIADDVDLNKALPAQGHSLQPGDAIYRLNEESNSIKKYDVISQIRSGVMTDDDPALHDDFEFDYDLEAVSAGKLSGQPLIGVEELEKTNRVNQEINVQQAVSIGRVEAQVFPDFSGLPSAAESQKSSPNRRPLEAVDWGKGGELCLRFEGGHVVRLTPATLLDQGIGSIAIEGYQMNIQAIQNGLMVFIPELHISLETSIRAA